MWQTALLNQKKVLKRNDIIQLCKQMYEIGTRIRHCTVLNCQVPHIGCLPAQCSALLVLLWSPSMNTSLFFISILLLLTVNPEQTASVLSCHFSLMFSLALLGPWGGSYKHHPHSHLSTRGDQRFSYLVQVCCLGIGWLL